MLRKVSLVLAALLVFSFSVTLSGDESAQTYFPSTLGSYWVYEDQDGNELTRTAVEDEEIAGETYHAFSYEPAFEEKWEHYEYYVHPTLFKVDETGIKFLIGDEVVKTYKERLTKELMAAFASPPGANVPAFDIEVEVETQPHFYLLPTPVSPNEEWDTTRIKPTVKVKMDFAQNNSEVDSELAGVFRSTTIYFTILETGNIFATEAVETPAGVFKDCLKIEYRTETVMPAPLGSNYFEAGESVSTLWLAPNVGIVKFHQESEKPIIGEEMGQVETMTTQIKTLELKKYEIKSDVPEAE